MPKHLSYLIAKLPAIVVAGLCLVVVTPAFAANNGNGNGNGKNQSSQTTTSTPTINSTPTSSQTGISTPSTPTTSSTPTSGPTQSGSVTTSALTSSFLTVGLSDINKSFLVNFDGNVSTQTVSGLSSEAQFTFKGFTTSQNKTVATFDVKLTNTSDGAIESRVSGLGFDTSGTLLSSSVSGLFGNAILGGSFPNQFGNMDVCFTQGNTCQGGQSGGVSSSESLPGTYGSGLFNLALTLDGMVNTLTLDNFGVRYQSIEGTNLGTSGTGSGVSVKPVFDKPIDGTKPPEDPTTPPPPQPPTPTPPKPKTVPEPSAVGAMLLLGAMAVRFGKKRDSLNFEK
jgi:hypothetical protein